MKKFISGLIIGSLTSISLVAFATEYNITTNSFPILIDGQASEIEGYNIDGYTYLKLADLKEAGLTVKFNETDSQIEITSQRSFKPDKKLSQDQNGERWEGENDRWFVESEEYEEYERTLEEERREREKEQPRYYRKDEKEMMDYKGEKYIELAYLSGFIRWDGESKKILLYQSHEAYKNGDAPVIDSVPYTPIKGITWVEYDYYIDTILPLIENSKKELEAEEAENESEQTEETNEAEE